MAAWKEIATHVKAGANKGSFEYTFKHTPARFEVGYLLTEPSLVALSIDHEGGEELLKKERRRDSGRVRQWVPLPESISQPATLLIRARPTFSAKKQLLVEKRLPLPAVMFNELVEEEK